MSLLAASTYVLVYSIEPRPSSPPLSLIVFALYRSLGRFMLFGRAHLLIPEFNGLCRKFASGCFRLVFVCGLLLVYLRTPTGKKDRNSHPFLVDMAHRSPRMMCSGHFLCFHTTSIYICVNSNSFLYINNITVVVVRMAVYLAPRGRMRLI